MRNREITPKEESIENSQQEENNERESGYSESQQALDIEMRSGDLQALKKNKTFKILGKVAKTVAAYRTVSYKLNHLVGEYTNLVEHDLHLAQRLIDEIKKVRAMQKMLLTKLFGKLDDNFPGKENIEEELKEFMGS